MLVSPVAPSDKIAQAKAEFDELGFTVIRGYLVGEDLERLRKETERYLQEVAPTISAGEVYYADKDDPQSVFRMSRMDQYDPYFKEFGNAQPFQELAETLLGEKADFKSIGMFGKAPRIGEVTPAHQDGYYHMIEPNHALMTWLAIDRSDRENGCIHYVPGSHKLGLRKHAQLGSFGFSQEIPDLSPEEVESEIVIEVDPGDMILHHSLSIHRTDPNPTDRRRWAVGMSYYASSVVPDEAARQAHQKKVEDQLKASGKI